MAKNINHFLDLDEMDSGILSSIIDVAHKLKAANKKNIDYSHLKARKSL